MAYVRKEILFCKRFKPRPDLPHVDSSCTTEAYIQDRFVELETLGPKVNLFPGDSVIHSEVWEIYALEIFIETIEQA
jgi:hypothetical protein